MRQFREGSAGLGIIAAQDEFRCSRSPKCGDKDKLAKWILQKLLFCFCTQASQRFIPVRKTTKPDNLIPMTEGVF